MSTKATLATLLLATTATACASTNDRTNRDYNPSPTYKTQAYIDCERSDTDDQVLGAVAGAVIGGVIGNEIKEGEGAYVGAGAGAIAGAKIGDKNCDKYNDPRYDDTRYTNRRTFGNDADYTVNGTTYYTEREVDFAIDRLELANDRIDADIRQAESRYQRDQLEDQRAEIRRDLNDLYDVKDRFDRYAS